MVEIFINENTSLATTQVKEQIKVMFEANNDEPIQYLLNVQSILNEDVLVVFYHFIKNQASLDDTWKIGCTSSLKISSHTFACTYQ